VAAVLLLGLGAGGFGSVYAYQQSRPTLVTWNLRDGQKDVSLQPELRLSATRPIESPALRKALQVSPAVEAQLVTADGGRSFTWTPRRPLADLTRYTLSLRSLRDAAGHPVKPVSWSFTTTIVPRVESLTLEGGAAVPDGGEVVAGSRLRIAFNDRMDPASVQLLAAGSPLQLSWAADGRSALFDTGGSPLARLDLALAPGARDSEGRSVSGWSQQVAVVHRPEVGTVSLRAPALVQVPNDPGARDQTGLQAADEVYEYLTEGDITRFTAVYTHAPSSVGPIRSGRLISFALTRHLHGMLFMSGVSDGSGARLAADPVPSVIDVPGVYYRRGDRIPPDNLFVRASSLQANEDRAQLPSYSLKRGGVPPSGGEPAATVAVPQHRSTYTYDPATLTYSKAEDGRTLRDAALEQPLRVQLLVVMHTTARPTDYVEDVNGLPGLDYDTESGGRADFYYGGLHATGRWSAPDRRSPFVFQLDSGAVVQLSLGLTWIDVVTG
jgi:hypothetical protein